jgi:hypothetical protein
LLSGMLANQYLMIKGRKKKPSTRPVSNTRKEQKKRQEENVFI